MHNTPPTHPAPHARYKAASRLPAAAGQQSLHQALALTAGPRLTDGFSLLSKAEKLCQATGHPTKLFSAAHRASSFPSYQTPEWLPQKPSSQRCRAASSARPSAWHRAPPASQPRDPSATGTGSSRSPQQGEGQMAKSAIQHGAGKPKQSLAPTPSRGLPAAPATQATCSASPCRAAVFNPCGAQRGQNFLYFPLVFQETKSAQEMPRTTEAPV